MTEPHSFDQPDSTDTPDSGASVLPFPLKKQPTAPEFKAGEWEAELPDDQPHADGDDVSEGDPVDPPKHVFPPSIAEVIEAKDKARRPVLPDWVTSAK